MAGDEDVAWPDDVVEVGRIIDAFGIKGWIRVQPYAAQPEALFSSKRWFLRPSAERPRPAGVAPLPQMLRISQAQEHGDGVVAQVRDIQDRNTAELLKGASIFVSRASFPSVGESEYYWVDLIGLQVVNRQGDDLGVVIDLLDTGAHSVLRLQPAVTEAVAEPVVDPVPAAAAVASRKKAKPPQPVAAPDERLIPFVAAYIDQVDLAGRCIVVDWGLDY